MLWLKSRLTSPDPKVRCQAVLKLAESNKAEDTLLLLGCLEDEESEVRATVARALGGHGDRRATGPLAAKLSDPNVEVRSEAARALRQLGWQPATAEELARFEIALGHAQTAAFAGTAALSPLVAELKHDTSFQRRAAAEALRELQDPRRVGPLLEALLDADPTVRISTIHALELELGAGVTAELVKMLLDTNPQVRLAAARALSGRPGVPAAHFLPLLQDTNFEVRLAAVQFLGRQGQPQLALALLPRLSDTDNDVRMAAATALGTLRCAAAIQSLVLTLADEERQVRLAAEHALDLIDPHWVRSQAARQSLGQIEALLEQRPTWVRAAMLQTLERIRSGSVSKASVRPLAER